LWRDKLCLILEHKHSLEKIKEQDALIAELQAGEYYKTHQPVSDKQITSSELYALLRSLFPGIAVNLGDSYRFLCHYDDITEFLVQDVTNKMPYISDRQNISSFDCNVFANRLLGQFSVPGWSDLCFGKAWLTIPAHALNIMIADDRKFWWIEPQTDELLEYNYYKPENVRWIEL